MGPVYDRQKAAFFSLLAYLFHGQAERGAAGDLRNKDRFGSRGAASPERFDDLFP
jgi:hypothetical protein